MLLLLLCLLSLLLLLISLIFVFFTTGFSGSFSGSLSLPGFKAAASLAYSQEESVTSATTAQAERGGTLFVSEVECLTYRAKISRKNLHPQFVLDLMYATLDGSTTAMLSVVKKYGTHYYTSADMGGKLTMTTSTTMTTDTFSSSISTEKAVEASMSAKVSGWGANAEAAASFSKASSGTEEFQSTFESTSTHSSIIAYGGAPGSFGPPGSDGAQNWGDWSQTVDLQPVAVSFQVDRIYNLLSSFSLGGINVSTLWQNAESMYYGSYVSPSCMLFFSARTQSKLFFCSSFEQCVSD